MKTEIVQPVVSNFIKSLRDVGYTFEVAVSDILDNSITANAKNINMICVPNPEMIFMMLDDGDGMTEEELVNAMRLSTNDPNKLREKGDLGKFGLGLKTASFSQCKKLTVISKVEGNLAIRQWDLNFIEQMNDWYLITPDIEYYNNNLLYKQLLTQPSGTLVIWENIDSFNKDDLVEQFNNLREHLSLVFHRFIEGDVPSKKKLAITMNNNPVESLNPFNEDHMATQKLLSEQIVYNNKKIIVQPYILPHHSKLNQIEFDKYALKDGYTKSQGFYLYRANRLLIYGTWWGLQKVSEAYKLVRIKVDIPNDMDEIWGIDIKKSTANPTGEIRKNLKSIIGEISTKGSKTYTKRGKKIKDPTMTKFWDLVAEREDFHFVINRQHPLIQKLSSDLSEEQQDFLEALFMGLEAFLPLDTIMAKLNTDPLHVKQELSMKDGNIENIIGLWKKKGLDEEFIKRLVKSEMFQGKEDFINGY